jgi:prolyl oligopeptidase
MIVRRLLAGTAFVALVAAAPPAFHYPPTPVHPVTDRYFGKTVVDPYRWLENGHDPAVERWAQAQAAFTLAYLRAQPSFGTYRARIAALSRTSTRRFGLQIAGGRYVFLRLTPPQAQPELVARDGIGGTERVLFDPRSAAGKGPPPAIESVYLSFDGKKVAFTTQLGGSEEETLHVVDAQTLAMLPDTLPHVGGGPAPVALVWDGDGKGFLHTQWPRNGDGSYSTNNMELWHHTLGTDPSTDTYVFGRGLSPRAEYTLLGSRDGKMQATFVTAGDGVHGSLYEREVGDEFGQVAAPIDGIGSSGDSQCAFAGDRLLAVSVGHDTRGQVVAIDPGETMSTAKIIVPAGPVVISDIVPVHGGFITLDVDGGDSSARFVNAAGNGKTIPLPPVSRLTDVAGDVGGSDIIIGYSGYTRPNRWLRYNAGKNTLASTRVVETAPGDYRRLTVKRAFAPSLDGTVMIPVEIVAMPNVKMNGTAPTMLSAYGAYGIVSGPFFVGPLLAFLDRGGVYVQAMVRGGGEYGEGWHLSAKLQTKTRSSDDLAAVAVWLGQHGYGNAKHLGIEGGSAGGFLMGLALTRNPKNYRAVVSFVGFYDLLRSERTPNGLYNTPEFGTVTDPAQFAWMVKQSPYQNVVKGRAYPGVLMLTGENDPRVDPYDSRKMTARLQAASSSPYPILLWQKSGEGHGIGNSFDQRVSNLAAELTFFDSQLR